MRNHSILFGIIILVATMSTCSKRNTLNEHESNDTFETSNMIDVDKNIIGYLSTASDMDFYSIDIAEPLRFEISASAVKGVNSSLSIYNSNKDMIKLIDDNRKSSSEKISNIWLEKGRYYICVAHGDRDEHKGNDENPYILFIKLVNQDSSQEKEPNDSIGSANVLEIDKPITGFYSPSMNKNNDDKRYADREVDWYTFDISDSSENMKTYDILLSGVKGIISDLSLYNSESILLMATDSTESGKPVSFKGNTLKEGRYYLCVASKNFESNSNDKYTLTITSSNADSVHENEPNNSIEDANIIESDVIKGTLFSDSDHDFFAVNNTDKSVMRFPLRFDDKTNLYLKLYNNNGNIIFEYTGNVSSVFTPPVVSNGKTVIEISSSGKNKSGNKYELATEKSQFSNTIEVEPNNDLKTAQPIVNEIIGYVNIKNDKDYYKLELSDRKKIRVSVQGIKNAIFDFSVTDPDGYIIRTKKLRNDETAKITETIDRIGYIIIESKKENQLYPYTLRIEE